MTESKPKCYLCDKPATHTRDGVRLCAKCNAEAPLGEYVEQPTKYEGTYSNELRWEPVTAESIEKAMAEIDASMRRPVTFRTKENPPIHWEWRPWLYTNNT